MRVLLDANIFISYLLPLRTAGVISEVVEAGLAGEYTLLSMPQLLNEMAQRVPTKAYLAARISREQLGELVSVLLANSEQIPEITQPLPAVSHDRKDDYLLAYAVVAQADYLVTGDIDLYSLVEVEGVRIVTPSEFSKILTSSK